MPLGSLQVGTSGFAYKEWRGNFYPEKMPEAKMLAYYAERFRTVEINYTFYRLPSAKTLEGWIPQTPEGFTFGLKGNQKITHILRLKDAGELLKAFYSGAQPLLDAGRLGPVLYQLPPNLKADHERLAGFLSLLPRSLRAAFEFRHASWFVPETFQLLRDHNAALCIAETDEECDPLEVTAGFVYLRLRKETYTDEWLGEWRRRIETWRNEGRDLFVYFKHEFSGAAPRYAARFLEQEKSGG